MVFCAPSASPTFGEHHAQLRSGRRQCLHQRSGPRPVTAVDAPRSPKHQPACSETPAQPSEDVLANTPPVQLSAPVLWTRFRASKRPPCFPGAGLCTRHPPSLNRVLASRVPRRHRYHEGATTSRCRLPSPYGFARRPRVLPPSSLPRAGGTIPRGPGPLIAGDLTGVAHDDNEISQVPGRSILYLCPVLRPRPSLPRLA